jgi:hypothetical protein
MQNIWTGYFLRFLVTQPTSPIEPIIALIMMVCRSAPSHLAVSPQTAAPTPLKANAREKWQKAQDGLLIFLLMP